MSAADAPRDLAWAVAEARSVIAASEGVTPPGGVIHADALRLLLGAAEDAGRWRELMSREYCVTKEGGSRVFYFGYPSLGVEPNLT